MRGIGFANAAQASVILVSLALVMFVIAGCGGALSDAPANNAEAHEGEGQEAQGTGRDNAATLTSAAEKVENATSAAPPHVADAATILDWPSQQGGDPSVLREGENGWTCFPDRADTPVNDPMCLDEVWMEWMAAHLEGRTADIERVGFSYMLQGGTAADQSSPFITEPPPGKDWYDVGPHVMIVVPDPEDLEGVSRDTQNGGPFVEALSHDHPIILFPVAGPDEALEVVEKGS